MTPSSCGRAKSVLSNRTDAPSLALAKIASAKPRWLRHMIATASSLETPALISARASAFERRSSSPKLTAPSSSIRATSSGLRAAAETIPAAGEAPQRRTARPTARSSPGDIGRMIPASARTLRLNGRSARLPSCPSFTCRIASPTGRVMLSIAPVTTIEIIGWPRRERLRARTRRRRSQRSPPPCRSPPAPRWSSPSRTPAL